MASRKEEKERRRQERLQEQRAQADQARRRRLYTIIVGGGLGLAAIAAVVVAVAAGGGDGGGGGDKGLDVKAVDPPAQKNADLTRAAQAAGCRLSNPAIEGRGHTTEKVKYKTNPPNSGSHNPVPADDGAYGAAPGIGNLVHSLEHGRILIQFSPSINRVRLAQLKGLFDEDPYHVILTPNPTNMPYQVAVVAWGHVAGCRRVNDATFDVIRAFTERYRDKAPEFVS